ncbi:MAG: hypothetical protein II822_04825 [Prevotella sp.]|nr:hypothetical protein [Prevotella sp.]
MNQKNNLTLVNSIATSLLAFVLAIPMHELFHLLTFYAYGLGDQVTLFSATCVGFDGTSVHFEQFSPFNRIMVAGGSASILNTIIGLALFFVLLKSRMGAMMRMFLTQLMGAHLTTGFGYFFIDPLTQLGDWGNVFSTFPDNPGLVLTMRIVLFLIGSAGIVFTFFALNYMSYYFVADPADKQQRLYVATRLHLVMLVVATVVGCIGGIVSPASGGSYFAVIFANMEWIVFFWAFMFTWVMVKHPKKSRYLYSLPQEPHWLLLIVSVVLILIDLMVLGPGVAVN